ncbi:MAG TPA: tetratricopeptide repeat protein [Longimicrobiales bacterium]
MKPIVKLKDQARLHEQREEWEQAIRLYLEVLRAGDERDGEAELGIYNRVGDLYLRLGQQAEAVRYYEQAADRYAEAGFYNNAIALCSKALRHMPGRSELYLRLGRFSAAQGFMMDARRWFLEYAEHMLRAGEEGKAFEALHELANASGDPDVRELLAGHLLDHGRTDEALVELKRAFAERLRAGQHAEAEALRSRILELDPGASFDEGGEEPAGRQPPVGARDDGGDGLTLVSAAGAAGIGEALPGEQHWGQEEPLPSLPLLDLEAEVAPLRPEGEKPTAPPLPLLDLGEEAVASRPESEKPTEPPLPLLDLGSETVEPDVEPLAGFEPTVQVPEPPAEVGAGDASGDAEGPEQEAERAIARAGELVLLGQTAEAVEELDAVQRRLADAGHLEEALRVVDEVVRLDPDRLRAHQDRVEYAFRLDRTERLVGDYLDLAAGLTRAGASERAASIYRRVLDLDPSNEAALAALGQGAGAAGGGEFGTGEELVDLGDLLRAEEEVADTTRFVVPEEEPTGDEERDFAEMLEQFKAKLAEHVAPDDLASHYDLGLAFKEMGLVDEAIAQFQTALRGGRAPLKIYEELGHCFVLKEQYNVAIKVLSRALQVPHQDDTELLGVFYLLGRCHEELGQQAEARDAYERVFGVDINFRDVAERLARL